MKFLFLALLGFLSLLFAPSSVSAADPIKIGALLPFSGGVELYGAQAKLGLDLAASEINAAGGILGHPIKIIYADDGTRPKSALEGTRKLIKEDRVFAMIGPITSQNLNAILPHIVKDKVPLLYATNYEGGVCNPYTFVFGTVPNQELTALLPYMTQTFGDTYFLLGADRVWPHKMFDVAEPLITKFGGHIAGKEFTLGTETDFAPLIGRIAATKARVLLFALKGDGMNFIPQADKLGLFKTVTVAFLGLSETDLPIFHGTGQNMYTVVPFVATDPTPAVQAFVAKARAQAGSDTAIISNYVVTHYNALMTLKAAMEKAGRIDREAMIHAMEGIVVNSPTGPITMDENHHVTMNMFLAKTEGSNLVVVKPLGEIAPEPGCP